MIEFGSQKALEIAKQPEFVDVCSVCGEPMLNKRIRKPTGETYYVCDTDDFCSAIEAGISAYDAEIEHKKARWAEESPFAIGW